jgi:hypothetical protein
MRKPAKLLVVSLVGGAVLASGVGIGVASSHHSSTSQLAGPTAPPVVSSPAAAEAVLGQLHFTWQGQSPKLATPPGMAGVVSAARGWNGNAEEAAFVFRTPAEAASEITWFQGQVSSMGLTGVVLVQAPEGQPATTVTVVGDDVHVDSFLTQALGYN